MKNTTSYSPVFQLHDGGGDGEAGTDDLDTGEAERTAVSMPMPDSPGLMMEAPTSLGVPSSQEEAGGGHMSRSVSETTLRRNNLRLNLNSSQQPQSAGPVLPSFTPLQQFKKELSVSRRLSGAGVCPRGHR